MADDSQLALYDFADAPSARRARIFIAEKGRAVGRVPVDLSAGHHLTPEYLAINPAGLIPALRLPSGEVITENAGIAAYLEALWPDPPLLGDTPVQRGRIAQWNARLEFEGLSPLAAYFRNSHPAFAGRAAPGVQAFAQIPALAERGRAQVEHFLPQLDRQIAENGFVAGPRFSFADITGIIFVDLVNMAQLSLPPSRSALAEWSARMRQRPSYGA
jgi:glutathione S-transferase